MTFRDGSPIKVVESRVVFQQPFVADPPFLSAFSMLRVAAYIVVLVVFLAWKRRCFQNLRQLDARIATARESIDQLDSEKIE